MIKGITDIVLEAGSIVREGFYDLNKRVNFKGAVDLVTEYDIKVEQFLKSQLSKAYPNLKIIAEESTVDIANETNEVIYIDPIDGTTNFVHGLPFVAISVGLYAGKAGKYGIVYNPILNELYSAETGNGAFLNGKEIHVSETASLINSLVATGFPYVRDNIPFLMDILNYILTSARGVRRMGSAALDLCYVARGTFDLYYETRLKPWDLAAGMIIVREAGGVVTHFDGKYHNVDSDTCVATNGLVHKEFLNLMSEKMV